MTENNKQFQDVNRQFIYTNEKGKEVTMPVTAQQMARIKGGESPKDVLKLGPQLPINNQKA